jgi:hypothetical protein
LTVTADVPTSNVYVDVVMPLVVVLDVAATVEETPVFTFVTVKDAFGL